MFYLQSSEEDTSSDEEVAARERYHSQKKLSKARRDMEEKFKQNDDEWMRTVSGQSSSGRNGNKDRSDGLNMGSRQLYEQNEDDHMMSVSGQSRSGRNGNTDRSDGPNMEFKDQMAQFRCVAQNVQGLRSMLNEVFYRTPTSDRHCNGEQRRVRTLADREHPTLGPSARGLYGAKGRRPSAGPKQP